MRDRLGIGESEEVGVEAVREKRHAQIMRLQRDSRMLEKEVGVASGRSLELDMVGVVLAI